MNKKTIIVFWDNNKFWVNNKDYIVCSSHSEFNDLDEATLKNARGFLVLCELPWDHESEEIPRTEFGGIRLVQRFIRNKMSLKAPVVFASFSDAKTICDRHSEYSIIKTPALKHLFVRLPASPEELYGTFEELENMTGTELAYTKLVFCDMKGVLVQINHVLEGRSKTEQDKYRKVIEYILRDQFNNDDVLIQQYRNTKDLSDFCKTLLARFEATGTHQGYDGFLHEQNHKTIKILMIEDEPEKDGNVKRFVEYIQDMEHNASQNDTPPLFSITVEQNMNNVAYNKMTGRKKYKVADFDVVICDIEIRDEEGKLVTMGFNVVEKMAKETKRPLYYIVTNVSRSFYDQIKIPYVRRIRLKKEVFGTKENIETFLYGIKEVYDNREAEAAEKVYKCETLLNKFSDFIKKDGEKYNAIEEEVRMKCMNLIKQFLLLFSANRFIYKDGDGRNFIVFEDNCKAMREHIKETIGLGNGNLDKNIAKREKNNQDLTDKDVADFVVRLVLRRFFLYVKGFIDRYDLMESFNGYKEIKGVEKVNKRKVFSCNDIACRAIGDQFKTLVDEYEGETTRPQSHCLDETLLYAVREPLRLTEEEQAFVDALENTNNPYPTSKSGITKLKVDY